MWPLIGALAALGLSAHEPTALLVVLVVLRSGRDRGVSFVIGWVTALSLVVFAAGFVVRLGLGPKPGGPKRVTLIIELIIGIAMIVWAGWYWVHSRGHVKSVEVPKHLARLTSINVISAFFTGVIACPYPPAIIAGTPLLRSDASSAARLAGLLTFVVVGTLMVALPVVGTFVAPAWAATRSDLLFNWTLHHRRTLVIVIVAVVGVFIAGRALLHLTHVALN